MDQHHVENTSPSRTSNIRPPSKLPAPASRHNEGPREISESEGNARAQTMMPPPPPYNTSSMKHKPTNLPEPPLKRKTLAERAGEVPRGHPAAPPSSRSVNGSVRSMAAGGIRNQREPYAGHARSMSNVSSVSSRTTSGTSASSVFNGSLGPGTRPPSSQSTYRPGSAMSYNRSYRPGLRQPASVDNSQHHIDVDPTPMSDQQKTQNPTTQVDLEKLSKEAEEFYKLNKQICATITDRSTLQDELVASKTRVNELETVRSQLSRTNEGLHATNDNLQSRNTTLQVANDNYQTQIDEARSKVNDVQSDLDDSKRQHRNDVDDLTRRHRNETEDLKDELRRANERSRREAEEETSRSQKAHQDQLSELEQRLRTEVEEEKKRRIEEVEELTRQLSLAQRDAHENGATRDRELSQMKSDVSRLELDLDRERSQKGDLRRALDESRTTITTLQTTTQNYESKIQFLESGSQEQSKEFAHLKQAEQEAITARDDAQAKLRQEETLRRKLHNQVQELKGNIRVFCRIRPTLPSDGEEAGAAEVTYPDANTDSKELVLQGAEQKSALGTVTTKQYPFTFDRVFGPTSQNAAIFDEISQLVQSALDGYNVCIFCYGQTGSGKTYTMSSESNGMIPLAVQQIYATADSLKEKGWTYTMEGSFIEIYNENLNDLLGTSEDLDKKKLEIKHDPAKLKTSITNVETMPLESPEMLDSLLKKAAKNRSVAATRANERSSRSHSVFMLRLTGTNTITGENSIGTLNLVDLAGSERLASSGATGDRLKETQNINKSLSSLGDVIGALGSGKEASHVPYRNSKLTYLLQYSLGGNSKTLMFVMCSPLERHLGETLTSLRFATKAHNTHIGTAKKQSRVKDS